MKEITEASRLHDFLLNRDLDRCQCTLKVRQTMDLEEKRRETDTKRDRRTDGQTDRVEGIEQLAYKVY